MASSKVPHPEPVPPGKRPAPGPMPTDGDGPREVFKRGNEDLRSRQDTDQEGWNAQRQKAPPPSPTRRSDKTDGVDDR